MTAPHPGTREYKNSVVRLADLTVTTDLLEDLRFENCTIIGPAVLAIYPGTGLVNCAFGAPDLNALFWIIPEDRNLIIGAIAAIRVEFFSCSFVRVGFAGPAELRAEMERGTDQGQ